MPYYKNSDGMEFIKKETPIMVDRYYKEKCSICHKKFDIKPFERNVFCWGCRHTETATMEPPSWICQKCKQKLTSQIQKMMVTKGD